MTNQPDSQHLAGRGHSLFQEGDYSTAARYFEQAALLFVGEGEKVLAAEMWNNCNAARRKAGDLQEALKLAKASQMVFTSAGLFCKKAMALGNQVAALEGLRRYEEALVTTETVLSIQPGLSLRQQAQEAAQHFLLPSRQVK